MKPPPLTTFLAIEQKSLSPHQVAGMFCEATKTLKTPFFQLESLSVIEISAVKFIRFRTDLADPTPALKYLLGRGHGIAYRGAEGYEFQLPSRQGKVSTSLMAASPIRNPQMWRGPKVKYWERQFMSP